MLRESGEQSVLNPGFSSYRTQQHRSTAESHPKIRPFNIMAGNISDFQRPAKGAGRKPIGLLRMLKIHFLQHWFELSDPAVEEALYDSQVMRQFVGIDLGLEPVPDETTICKFRHRMERHNLGDELFRLVNVYLSENGLKVSRGTIVDASIIHAPTSTKNQNKTRDPDMHQTRKGKQWYFGMKAHIGVDSRTKLIHAVVVTPANVHDSQVMGDLLHGDETRVWGDSAYSGQTKVIREQAPMAKDFTQKKGSRYRKLTEADRARNRTKSRVRAKVEHVFGVMKGQFGYTKVRYKGLDKNAQAVFTKCALVNLVMAKKQLLAV